MYYDFLFPFKHVFQQIQKETVSFINNKKVLSGRDSEKTAPNILFFFKLNIIYKSVFHKIMFLFFLLFIYYYLNIYYRDQDFTPDNPPQQNNLTPTQV